MVNPILTIAPEIQLGILGNLDPAELIRSGAVCKAFKLLTEDCSLWTAIAGKFKIEIHNKENPKHDVMNEMIWRNNITQKLIGVLRDDEKSPVQLLPLFLPKNPFELDLTIRNLFEYTRNNEEAFSKLVDLVSFPTTMLYVFTYSKKIDEKFTDTCAFHHLLAGKTQPLCKLSILKQRQLIKFFATTRSLRAPEYVEDKATDRLYQYIDNYQPGLEQLAQNCGILPTPEHLQKRMRRVFDTSVKISGYVVSCKIFLK